MAGRDIIARRVKQQQVGPTQAQTFAQRGQLLGTIGGAAAGFAAGGLAGASIGAGLGGKLGGVAGSVAADAIPEEEANDPMTYRNALVAATQQPQEVKSQIIPTLMEGFKVSLGIAQAAQGGQPRAAAPVAPAVNAIEPAFRGL